MDNPTYDEAIYMVRVKRRRAKEAMSAIVQRYGIISHEPAPGLEVLLDYFMNMVYGLELLLKVMAKDWETPGKSKFGHKVGKMYDAVFSRPHPDPAFMKEVEDAILDQKFICEPAKGLMDRVEAVEALWDELKAEYRKRSWEQVSTVHKEVKADASFGQYLLRNVDRFTPPPTYQHDMRTNEEKIAMKRAQLEHIQREITRLETEGEPEVTMPDLHFRLLQEYREKVESIRNIMALQFQMWGNSEIGFMIYRVGIASEDLG